MKTKQILLFILFVFSIEKGVAQILYIGEENASASSFPGGYISVAIQWGKNSDGVKFRSYQTNVGVASIIYDPGNVTLFSGLTIGKRKFKNNTSYNYYDLQFAIAPWTPIGLGFGKAKIDGNWHNRIKGWIGLGPLLYSRDLLYLPDEKIVNRGFMFSWPIIVVCGNQLTYEN